MYTRCFLSLLFATVLVVLTQYEFENARVHRLFLRNPNRNGKASTNTTSARREPSILLVTYVFSQQAMEKRTLHMFLESAKHSGVDILLMGDSHPPYELPTSLQFVQLSWDAFCDVVSERVFEGQPVDELRTAAPYKINDFKPLFGHLFPHYVASYDFWGHVDNDMLLGRVRNFLPPLNTVDVISAIDDHNTWGAFTLYRNTAYINTLFKQVDFGVSRIFNNPKPLCFDEWGSCGYRKRYGNSMSDILDNQQNTGLRIHRGLEGVVWDGVCKFRRNYHVPKQHCAECLFVNGTLYHNHSEALLCHYQHSKDRLEASLQDDILYQSLVETNEFRANYSYGFDSL